MKIKDLVEQLKQYDENLEIQIKYSYVHSCFCSDVSKIKFIYLHINKKITHNKKTNKVYLCTY